MALTVETGSGVTGADSYDTVANVDTYWRAMGYLGTWQGGSPLVKGAVSANASQMTIDGGSGSETALAGDKFQVASVAGVFTVAEDSRAVSGEGIVKFSPVAPSGGFGDNAVVTFLGATEAQCVRGARTLDFYFADSLQGERSSTTQGLQWPRQYMEDEDGNLIASDTLPTRWKHAFYEMARLVPADQAMDISGWIERVKAGSAEVEFANGLRFRTSLNYVKELVSIYTGRSARIRRGA